MGQILIPVLPLLQSEEERLRDQKEREELERLLREKDASRTTKV